MPAPLTFTQTAHLIRIGVNVLIIDELFVHLWHYYNSNYHFTMHTEWQTIDNKLYKKFTCENFISALSFMVEVGFYAEQMQHHPEWKNAYNTVEVWLTTHDANNIITEKDHKLAELVDKVYKSKT